MVAPIRPYLPLGSLRAALLYPADGPPPAPARIEKVLARCGLAHLLARLDEVERWERLLAAGELQRLGIARAILRAPDLVLLDEALGSLDHAAAAELLAVLRRELPGVAILTLAQRADLAPLHDRELRLEPGPDGAVLRPLPGRPRVDLARPLPARGAA